MGSIVGADGFGFSGEELLKGDGCCGVQVLAIDCVRDERGLTEGKCEHVGECSGGVEDDMELRCLEEDIPICCPPTKGPLGCSSIGHES